MRTEEEIRKEMAMMEAARDSSIKRGDDEIALLCNAKYWELQWVLGGEKK